LREEFAITPGRHEGQVFFCDPGIAGQEELIEDLVAGSASLLFRYVPDEAIVGKLLRNTKTPAAMRCLIC
jgi:hypothetical protein